MNKDSRCIYNLESDIVRQKCYVEKLTELFWEINGYYIQLQLGIKKARENGKEKKEILLTLARPTVRHDNLK